MADDFKTRPTPPAPPPRGMIKIDGEWQVRRFGLLIQRELTCIYGHHIQVGARPFEISIPCNHMTERFTHASARCSAQLYIFVTRPRMVWAMDLTQAESETIAHHLDSIEAIVNHFGCGFPSEHKITRLKA
jgi:hypothetical protein